jgi:hypothetical protein
MAETKTTSPATARKVNLNQVNQQLAKNLSGLQCPANKQAVLDCALDNNAPLETMQVLDKLADKQYHSLIDIHKEIENLPSKL